MKHINVLLLSLSVCVCVCVCVCVHTMDDAVALQQPSYEELHTLLTENNGDPCELLRRYPHFDAHVTPNDGESDYDDYDEDRTFLSEVSKHINLAVVQGLVACGAFEHQQDQCGFTPLMHVCFGWIEEKEKEKEKRAKVVSWLLTHSKSTRETVNCHDNAKWTAFHYVVSNHNIALVRVLLFHDANPTILGGYGKSSPKSMVQWLLAKPKWHEIATLLETTRRECAVLQLGEWRPHTHHHFSSMYRNVIRTLVILAKARTPNPADAQELVSHYPQSRLDLLPEELMQFVFSLLTVAPVPDTWTQ